MNEQTKSLTLHAKHLCSQIAGMRRPSIYGRKVHELLTLTITGKCAWLASVSIIQHCCLKKN